MVLVDAFQVAPCPVGIGRRKCSASSPEVGQDGEDVRLSMFPVHTCCPAKLALFFLMQLHRYITVQSSSLCR